MSGNGKLDRSALPAPDLVTSVPTRTPSADGETPTAGHPTGIERRVRELWAEEFGIDADGIAADASFFDLGGHSITAMRLVNRVREDFATEYPMLSFYQEPTLRAMTAQVAAAAGETAEPEPANASPEADDDGPGTVEHRAPATVQQSRFATVHADHRLPQVFNVALRITLTGDLDVAALRTALTGLVERHEGLRTRLARSGDGWEQQVLRARPVELPVGDLTGLPAGNGRLPWTGPVPRRRRRRSTPPAGLRWRCASCAPVRATGHCSSSCTTPPATDGPSACS
ncbi:phosphopantetheine-binding protein [Streptomyces sp. MS1.AVA.1]|uniref:Phosphopantetheine-binding protein n=1 Tax=Streptomyces machairae TaxID=3134109 RepID=A0ABU8UU78_9ACTN